ncbi:hypothetical protein AYI69_g9309 [Smittium culicis]|uniref:Uncharacterized protein n=1 Tax=Smittium culicis TaxID=133412 RepID=A0A1R1XDM0_9FUNG|nr:hypothetical protein AYI69_g9309 [Smittium culicis]
MAIGPASIFATSLSRPVSELNRYGVIGSGAGKCELRGNLTCVYSAGVIDIASGADSPNLPSLKSYWSGHFDSGFCIKKQPTTEQLDKV